MKSQHVVDKRAGGGDGRAHLCLHCRLLLQARLRRPVVTTSICAISSCAPARRAEGGALAGCTDATLGLREKGTEALR